MNTKTLGTISVSLLLGVLYLMVMMGTGMGLVVLNAQVSPNFVWFPIPASILVVVSMMWAQKRWDIGLSQPKNLPLTRIYIIGTALTILGIATAIVQGKYTGYVRETELLGMETSPLFAIVFAIFMSVLAAVVAETAFRGICQARMEKVLSIWPTVLVIGFVNVIAHRWGPEILQNWLGLFVTLAGWTYLRWLSKSLWPPLILHALTNFIVAILLWFKGPFDQATLGNNDVIAISAVGLVALGIAIQQTKQMQKN
ncbi:MAG: type II CAAX endopeptidase family protein [Pseudomonadota bacterium]|nr:type II CAAX endopeptidase family protein [Pseudomonadota bacterium]